MTAISTEAIPPYLNREITFDNNTTYTLLQPITTLRSCHDGTPAESRILFTCRQTAPPTAKADDEEAIMKIKVQIPGGDRRPSNDPLPGPSTTTTEELKVLSTFATANLPNVPHLLAHKLSQQPAGGPMPSGYVSYTAMTRVPGRPLFEQKYWEMSAEAREVIVGKFMGVLRGVYASGVEPIDCGLRNVMWDADGGEDGKGVCSIIDFELWREAEEGVGDEVKELQRWGLVRRPPSKDWWAEWNTQGR